MSPEARLHLVELRLRGMIRDRELLLAELILQRALATSPELAGLDHAISALRSAIADLKLLAVDLG